MITIEKLHPNEILKLSKFVVTENYKHHEGFVKNKAKILDEILYVLDEENKFVKNSTVFVAKNSNSNIEGVIRVLKWNYKDKLPLQRIFGINPFEIVGTSPLKSIWHVGRFAVKKGCTDMNLFKKLLMCALSLICESENSVVFAECDCKLLRILNLIGIKTKIIGEPVNYLGSKTIPVYMPYDCIINYFNKHKGMLPQKHTSKLPKSVVFNTISPTTL